MQIEDRSALAAFFPANSTAREVVQSGWDLVRRLHPINADNPCELPAPSEVQNMSADELLMILAASDPGAAMRVWAAGKVKTEHGFDEGLDSAEPADLDPFRTYALANTFLHRIRSRARVFARLRQNLERPVRTKQALIWKLEGS